MCIIYIYMYISVCAVFLVTWRGRGPSVGLPLGGRAVPARRRLEVSGTAGPERLFREEVRPWRPHRG